MTYSMCEWVVCFELTHKVNQVRETIFIHAILPFNERTHS